MKASGSLFGAILNLEYTWIQSGVICIARQKQRHKSLVTKCLLALCFFGNTTNVDFSHFVVVNPLLQLTIMISVET